MLEHAAEVGANALIGVRYDANIDEFVNWVEFKPFIEAMGRSGSSGSSD